MNYRLGLDLGIGSVGWCVLGHDSNEQVDRIVDLGVRVFPIAEGDKGRSTAAIRREFRSGRRRLRRREHRLDRVRNYLKRNFDFCESVPISDSVHILRYRALDSSISNNDLCRIVLYFMKHRGYLSVRKSEENDKDIGKMLTGVQENESLLTTQNYRTIGEMICKDAKFQGNNDKVKSLLVRNKGGKYSNTFYRKTLAKELRLILESQKEFGNKHINADVIERLITIFMYQRPFDLGPSEPSIYKNSFMVGNCTFEQGEKRASKGSFTFQYFNNLSKINNLKIISSTEGIKTLRDDQRKKIISKMLIVEKVKYTDIRKLLELNEDAVFNMNIYKKKEEKSKSEQKVFLTFEKSRSIKKSVTSREISNDEIDELALILSMNKSDDRIMNALKESPSLRDLSSVDIDNLLKLNISEFGSLSIKAMKKIIPHLEQGLRYDVACSGAGYGFNSTNYEKRKYLKGKDIDELVNEINVASVRRSINQTIKIVNSLVKKYGSPQRINIELARELSKTFLDRCKINKDNNERQANNEKILQRLKDEFGLWSPKPIDIVKLRLYEEQGGKCAYSQKPIPAQLLFEPNFTQVDHAIPYSRCFDDSYNNKVLVLTEENQNKGNKIPYEYFGNDGERWQSFVAFATISYAGNSSKLAKLTRKIWTSDDEKEYTNANLNDTKYISKFMMNLLKDYLMFENSATFKKKPVMAVNGKITSYMRKCWGINKIREDGDLHHCIDAAVIGCVSDSFIQKITKFVKYKEQKIRINLNNQYGFADITTGEVFNKQVNDNCISIEELNLYKTLPMPYLSFVEELRCRTENNYTQSFSKAVLDRLSNLGYSDVELQHIRPVFVSRMKTNKITGAIHKATIGSARLINEGYIVRRVKLDRLVVVPKQDIALKDDPYPTFSIQDYYNPQDDRLLYLYLKKKLVESGGGNPFKEPVFKPTSTGEPGAIVNTVKVKEHITMPIVLEKVNGLASNDSMVRIDIFKKANKFYLIPIYVADVYKHELPNKVSTAAKPYSDWREIDGTYEFLFSLAQNDLIKLSSKKPMVLKKTNKNEKSHLEDEFSANEMFLYYNFTNIHNVSISCKVHDNAYFLEGKGIQNVNSIEKYFVDELGNIFHSPVEERKDI